MTAWAETLLRNRWRVLLVAVALMLVAGAWGGSVMQRLSSAGYSDPGSEAVQVQNLLEQHFGPQTPDVVALYTAPDGKTLDDIGPAVEHAISGIDPSLLAKPIQTYWNAPPLARSMLKSADGRTALAVVFAAGDDDRRLHSYDEIRDGLEVPGVHVQLTGYSALANQINGQSQDDLIRAETLSLPITLLVLVLIFGGVVAAALPVFVGGLAILGSMASLRLITEFTQVNTFAVNVASLLGLGLAIDYGLFIVSRYREELGAGATVPDAIRRTMTTAGRTVGFSALLLVCAFSGTLVFPQAMLKSLGFGAMSAVAVAALLSLTVLPAALALLGHRIGMWSWRKGAFERGEARAQRLWGRITGAVMKRPAAVALVIATVLIALATPLLGVKFGDVDARALPAGNPGRVAVEQLTKDFPAANSGVSVVVKGKSGAPSSDAVAAVRSSVAAVPGVRQERQAGAADNFVLLHASLTAGDRSPAAMDVVAALRHIPAPTGTEVLLGGFTADTADGVSAILHWLPVMLAIMTAATLALMFIAFRSVVLPIKAVLMAFLSLGATFGVLTWIFYDGHLAGLFQISQGPLPAGMVVLVISVIFGLSTDYEVFLISRMVEAHRTGATTEQAVRTGAMKTGRVVTAAATLLITVTAAFTLSGLTPMRFIGIGMIVALLIDATLVRMMLVPALVKLMGKANWWSPIGPAPVSVVPSPHRESSAKIEA